MAIGFPWQSNCSEQGALTMSSESQPTIQVTTSFVPIGEGTLDLPCHSLTKTKWLSFFMFPLRTAAASDHSMNS